MPKPLPGDYPAYFENYIKQVQEDDLAKAFEKQRAWVDDFFNQITEEKSAYAYAPGKWTLKELLQHIIDTERIFNYRALAFARKETMSLPGFDENNYAANSSANDRSWKSLCEELKTVRMGTEMLFNSFNQDMMNSKGLANSNPVTVNAIGFISVGHLIHHKKVIESKYL